jgi:hypothetical protein
MISTKAFDNLNISDPAIWKTLEKGIDRLLHKLKSHHIIEILELFNKEPFRGTNEFFGKLLTIIPIHIEHLPDKSILSLISICLSKNMKNDRLFNYFIYPRIEARAKHLDFENYVETLKMLAELGYQEDLIFWNEHLLPHIFDFEFSYEQAIKLWETFAILRINCPKVEIAKFVILVENIISQFEGLKNSGKDLKGVTLGLTIDLNLIPKQTSKKVSLNKIKETERRLKDKNALQGIMKDLGLEKQTGKTETVEESLNRIYDVKDWKKAKYEAEQIQQTSRKLQEMAKAENVVETTTVAEENNNGDSDKDNNKNVETDKS